MASLPYPRTPLSPRLYPSFFRFTLFFSLFTPSLFLFILPTFVIRIDRRGCSYRPTQMIFVDVSQCQTFTFAVSNLYFRAAKPLLLRLKTSLFTFYTLFFL